MDKTNPSWINEGRKEDFRCEEASLYVPSTERMFVPCAAPATHRLWSDKDSRHYLMCGMCCYTNTRRGMVEVPYEENPK